MIEAVNSVISNAPVARAAAVQASTVNSFAADQVAVESVARGPVAPFISPYISVDTNFDTAVLQIRDSDTGDVLTQFPSESALQQRQRQAVRQESQALQERPVARVQPREVQSAPTETAAFQATTLAQASAPAEVNTTAGAAQVAIAALSAGAQSGQASAGSVNVTA